MNWDAWLPVMVVASSLLPGLVIFFLSEGSHRSRTALNLAGAILKLLLVGIMIWGVFHEHVYETRWTLAPGLELVLHADTLSVLFVTLSTVLWLVTTVYAIGYLENSPHRSRFFGFFSLCVTATVGLALATLVFMTGLVYRRTKTTLLTKLGGLFDHIPFAEAGFSFFRSETRNSRFSRKALASNDDLPMVQWTIPALSARKRT